jgi:hypothetical protein
VARWLGLAVGFALALGLTAWAAFGAAERFDLPYVTSSLDVLPLLRERFATARERRTAERRVLFLGDSLAIDTRRPDTSIPEQLRQLLNEDAGEPRTELAALVGPALSVYSHYYLSECSLALEPDVVVVAVNPRTFSRFWLREDRVELAAWLPRQRWPEALRLPLHTAGLRLDGLVLHHALVSLGGVDAWHRLQREQVRLAWAPRALARGLQERAGLPDGLSFVTLHQQAGLRAEKTAANRATPATVDALLGPTLAGLGPDDPGLAVLDALLARFEAAGVPAVVYLAPTNIERLAALGLHDREGLAGTGARLAEVARRRGAVFLDLHALLPDAAFHDHLDHLVHGVPDEGSRAVAERLAPMVAERLQNAPRPPKTHPSCPALQPSRMNLGDVPGA